MDNWPQPHEGIVGELRDDDLLSRDAKAIPVRLAMRQLAGYLHDAILVGEPAPKVKRMYERLRSPRIGDLVMEESTRYRADEENAVKGFGILIAHRQEWWTTDEEWEAHVAEERQSYEDGDYGEFDEAAYRAERSTDHAWYIQYGRHPGAICRWTNCSFLVIPTTPRFFEEVPVGTPDGTGAVVITRDDLLGSLADSGFTLGAESIEGESDE